MDPDITQKTLEALKSAQQNPQLAKTSTFAESTNAVQGLTYYDLEIGAKLLYPVLTPLRNEIPRVNGKGGIQANWRAITAINTGGVRAGVSAGNRGGMIATTVSNYIAAYAGLGLEAAVDFEADYAAMGFDDAKALAAKILLESLMIQEELTIFGGDNSLALGTTATPTVAAVAGSGSNITATTMYVVCVYLTMSGIQASSVTGGIPGQVSRTNTDSSTDTFGGGSAQPSTAGTATGSAGGTVTATVATKAGAFAYAWFWNQTSAASATLGAITYTNSVTITTSAGSGTQTVSAIPGGSSTDFSTCALDFDGLLTQASKGNGSYTAWQATGTPGTGTPLTADGEGGIVEIDAALKSFWDNYRLSPDIILVNSQEQTNIGKKILSGGTSAAQRFVFTAEQGMIAGGVMARSYLNKYTMNGAVEIPIKLHPNCPPGTIVFLSRKLPYPLSNVSNVMRIVTRKEYYQIEWPLRTRRYEYGVYCDEVLQHYFPPSMGYISNVANG